MTQSEDEPDEGEPAERAGWSVGVWAPIAATVFWVVLAVRTPTNTFHFAPTVVAVVWPLLRRVDARDPLPSAEARLVAGAGTALAIAVGSALAFSGNLDGPALWGASDGVLDDPLFEVIVFALVGGFAGYRVASRPWHGPAF